MEEKTVNKTGFFGGFAGLILTELFFVAAIIIAVLSIKEFSSEMYLKLKVFYTQSFCVETDPDALLSMTEADDAL